MDAGSARTSTGSGWGWTPPIASSSSSFYPRSPWDDGSPIGHFFPSFFRWRREGGPLDRALVPRRWIQPTHRKRKERNWIWIRIPQRINRHLIGGKEVVGCAVDHEARRHANRRLRAHQGHPAHPKRKTRKQTGQRRRARRRKRSARRCTGKTEVDRTYAGSKHAVAHIRWKHRWTAAQSTGACEEHATRKKNGRKNTLRDDERREEKKKKTKEETRSFIRGEADEGKRTEQDTVDVHDRRTKNETGRTRWGQTETWPSTCTGGFDGTRTEAPCLSGQSRLRPCHRCPAENRTPSKSAEESSSTQRGLETWKRANESGVLDV